jgi:hypothetical protein
VAVGNDPNTRGVVLQSDVSAKSTMVLDKNLGGLCPGDIRKITAPSDHTGFGGLAFQFSETVRIPANSTIIYVLEVLDVTEEMPNDFLDSLLDKSTNAFITNDPAATAVGTLEGYKRVMLTAEMHPEWAEENQEYIEQWERDWAKYEERIEEAAEKKRKKEEEKRLVEEEEEKERRLEEEEKKEKEGEL